jgi:hypothetical protein
MLLKLVPRSPNSSFDATATVEVKSPLANFSKAIFNFEMFLVIHLLNKIEIIVEATPAINANNAIAFLIGLTSCNSSSRSITPSIFHPLSLLVTYTLYFC